MLKEPHFNRVIELMLKAHGLDYHYIPGALMRPIINSRWHLELPYIPEEKWKQKNFRLVIHAQDFIHFFGNLCSELFWLEQNLTPEQQKKVIFIHWDHSLGQVYEGLISCVEFATHSYEFVNGLKDRYNDWKDVHTKNIKYNWLCLNGRPRDYRQTVYNLLRNEESGFVSHSVFNPVTVHPYQKYNFDNVDNFVQLKSVYQSARSSIVTESLYQDVGGIITEKTLSAIAAKHPFMCIGHKGIHREIEERGFKLYNNLFDLDYDNESNETRLASAIEKNLAVLREPINLDLYADQVDYNFDFLMNDYTKSIRQRAENELAVVVKKGF